MITLYRGVRDPLQGAVVYQVDDQGEITPLPWRHTLLWWNHSPTGLEWGYGGSGPAQLSLALLGDVRGEKFAMTYYQRFKFEVVAALGREWTLTREQIDNWCEYQEQE